MSELLQDGQKTTGEDLLAPVDIDKLPTAPPGYGLERIGPSRAESMHPIAHALMTAKQCLDSDGEPELPDNPAALAFQTALPTLQSELSNIDPDMLKSMAQKGGVDEVNKFLRKNGFNIQLEPVGSDSLSVVSVLDANVRWHEKGTRAKIILPKEDNRQVDGVHLKNGVRFFSHPKFPYLIAKLPTKSDAVSVDRSGFTIQLSRVQQTQLTKSTEPRPVEAGVYITPMPYGLPPHQFACTAVAATLSKQMLEERFPEDSKGEIKGIKFPMVDFSQNTDLSWLKGTKVVSQTGQEATIEQALQENRLRMNELGARAQSAVAMGLTLGASRPKHPYVIDGPFLVWFTSKGSNIPFFVAQITSAHMKDPGTLS